jgi:hypothetical protein
VALRRTTWSEHGMTSVTQTRPHCVNQMGKTHSKPLAAQHGRGTAWARHGNGMLRVNRPSQYCTVYSQFSYSWRKCTFRCEGCSHLTHVNILYLHKCKTTNLTEYSASLQVLLCSQKVICLKLSSHKHVSDVIHNRAEHMLGKCCLSKSYKG